MKHVDSSAARERLRQQQEADRKADNFAVCDACGEVCRRLPEPLPSGQRFTSCLCLEPDPADAHLDERARQRDHDGGDAGFTVHAPPDTNPYL